MNESESKLQLNFFPFDKQDFVIPIYRKVVSNPISLKDENTQVYNLPKSLLGDDYQRYFVSMLAREGYELAFISSKSNFYFSNWFIYESIKNKCLKNSDIQFPNDRFTKIRFFCVLFSDDVGKDTVWVEPYFLKSKQQLGILCRFQFIRNKTNNINYKTILCRSLALKKNGRVNNNYYLDQYEKIQRFYQEFHNKLFPIQFNDQEININPSLVTIDQSKLKTKLYEFQDSKTRNSQYSGLKEYGPYQKIENLSPHFIFVFTEQFRSLSYDLYYALEGKKVPTFGGMQKLFRIPINKDSVTGKSINTYNETSVVSVINDVNKLSSTKIPIVIMIIPDDLDDLDYHKFKYLFLKNKIASQFVRASTISNDYSLKWAVSNIALGIFAKLGGKPWQIHESGRKGLIVGMGQSYFLDKSTGEIDRYFAYSILTDTTGIVRQLYVLANTDNKQSYLTQLRIELTKLLQEKITNYDSVSIHTPFNFENVEMQSIFSAIQEVDNKEIEFVVMRFDERSKFIAFDNHNNSITPYESSYLQLARNEYLVWFEGLQYHNPNLQTQIALPMHIVFEYPNEISEESQSRFLQEALNLSGANWRGFNAKTSPISFYYSRLVSRYISFFDRLGYTDLNIEDLPLWFL